MGKLAAAAGPDAQREAIARETFTRDSRGRGPRACNIVWACVRERACVQVAPSGVRIGTSSFHEAKKLEPKLAVWRLDGMCLDDMCLGDMCIAMCKDMCIDACFVV